MRLPTAASSASSAAYLEELLEVTPKHSQGCHERLRIEALLGEHLNCLAKCRLELGQLLHTRLAECVILLLVTMELCMICIELGIESKFLCLFYVKTADEIVLTHLDHAFICETAQGERTALFLESIESVSKMIVVFFAVEMLLKLAVAPCQVMQNPWHFLDCTVVALNVFFAFVLNQEGCREHATLLLRWWRTIKFLKLVEEEVDLVEEYIKKKFRNDLGKSSQEGHHPYHKQDEAQQKSITQIHSDHSESKAFSAESKQCEVSSSPGLSSSFSFTQYTAKKGTQIGAGLGTAIGTTIGAGLGVLPAFFTFGISIPVFAAVGGGTGLVLGSTVGAAAGFAGGWATQRLKAD
eukprot:s298_g32.t1